MYYIAELTKRKRIFQKPYFICENRIYITDTSRAKKKFLKSGIRNVVFSEKFKLDKIMGEKLISMKAYDREFVLSFLEEMLICIMSFFKLEYPLGEIAVFSQEPDEIVKVCSAYARIVSIVGEDGDAHSKDGVSIRHVRKLKSLPDLYITEGERAFSSIFNIPVIELSGESPNRAVTLSYRHISFETDLFPFEIDAETMMYLKCCDENISYKVTSLRKKLPPLFTFG